MGKSISRTVGGIVFPTKGELETFIRAVLYGSQVGVPLTSFSGFFADLLSTHRHYDQKVGCGIAHFYVDVVQTPYGASKCFHLKRTDGSSTDFSFRECMSPSKVADDIKFCCRRAIGDDIIAFKSAFFAKTPSTICPLNGEVVTEANYNVDHEDPQFATLIRQWMAASGLTFETIPVTQGVDNSCEQTLADAAQRASWVAYHRDRAKLRITSVSGNMCRQRAPKV